MSDKLTIISEEKSLQIRSNYELASKLKLDLIESVGHKLNETQFEIVRAGVSEMPIRLSSRENFGPLIEMVMIRILKKVGFRISTEDQKQSFVEEYSIEFQNHIRSFYSDLTVMEINLAFALSISGALDKFLPRNKYGEPEKGHYQNFSMEYVSRILNAYKSHKNEVWAKAWGMDKQEDKEPTEEELAKSWKYIDTLIVESFKKYRDEEVDPKFPIVHLITNIFKDLGMISGEKEEPSDHDRALAISNIKKNLRSSLSSSLRPEEVEPKADLYQQHRKIREVFDTLIETGLDIEELLNQRNNE